MTVAPVATLFKAPQHVRKLSVTQHHTITGLRMILLHDDGAFVHKVHVIGCLAVAIHNGFRYVVQRAEVVGKRDKVSIDDSTQEVY